MPTEWDFPSCISFGAASAVPAAEPLLTLPSSGARDVYKRQAVDVLPPALREKRLQTYQINFIHEAKIGDTLSLYTAVDGNTCLLYTSVYDCAKQPERNVDIHE